VRSMLLLRISAQNKQQRHSREVTWKSLVNSWLPAMNLWS
jgi:hypothetical protein